MICVMVRYTFFQIDRNSEPEISSKKRDIPDEMSPQNYNNR